MLKSLVEKLKECEEDKQKILLQNSEIKNLIDKILHSHKVKKEDILKTFKKIERLLVLNSEKIFEKNYLTFSSFLELMINEKNVYLLLIDVENFNSKQIDFLINYFYNKISPVISLKDKILYIYLSEKKVDEIKKLNTLPYYDPLTSEFEELELFKVLFIIEEFNPKVLEEIEKKFYEFKKRPMFKKRHFIVFDLNSKKVVDLDIEEIKKEKEKFSYIYDETYPTLELKLKQNIENLAFILAILERIDKELEEIKDSRGIKNVVNRILNFIDLRIKDNEIRKMAEVLKNSLKE